MSDIAQRESKLPETAVVCLVMTALTISTTVIGAINAPGGTNVQQSANCTGVLVLTITMATLFSLVTRSRISAIIAMGVTGYGLSLIFLYYSAVDLAITQIVAETLTVVMFMLVLQRLPVFARLSGRATRYRDLAIALLFGGAMTLLTLKALHVNFNHPISDYFLENSYIRAFGQNVVNVILVDFRALDTLGEVTVLVIAALGVSMLLQLKDKKS